MVDTLVAPVSATTLRAAAESAPSCNTDTSSLENPVSTEESTTYKDANAYRDAIELASRSCWSAGPLGMMCS